MSLADVLGMFAAPKAASGAVFNISVDAGIGAQLPAAMLFENSHTPTNRVHHHLARQISAAGESPFCRANAWCRLSFLLSTHIGRWPTCWLIVHSGRRTCRLLGQDIPGEL